jgi:DNA-binding CsgD family transcriptional regulator
MRFAAWARRLGPIWRLIVVGTLVCAGLAAVEVWFIESRFVEVIFTQSAARATDQVHLGVLSRANAADFSPPHTPDRLADLGARLRPVLAPSHGIGSGVLAVNLVASDGTVIYSDAPRGVGQRVGLADHALLQEALEGRLGAAVDGLSGPEDSTLKALYDEALEVYVPVVVDGVVVGAYELYQDVSGFRSVRPGLWAVLTIGQAALLQLALGLSLHQVRRQNRTLGRTSTPRVDGTLLRPLTPRELEVLGLLAFGHTYRTVAVQLTLSEETVRTHVKRILHKMGQPNRTAAVAVALRAGLIGPSLDN